MTSHTLLIPCPNGCCGEELRVEYEIVPGEARTRYYPGSRAYVNVLSTFDRECLCRVDDATLALAVEDEMWGAGEMTGPGKDPRLTGIYWPLFDRFEALANDVDAAVPKLRRMGDDRAADRLSALAAMLNDIAAHLEDGEVPDYVWGGDR